jgi:outer membrane protein OmpA-like peptidoglycan-associated protein
VARIAAVEASVTGIQPADLGPVQTELASLSSSVAALQTQIGDFDPARLDDLSGRIDTLTEEVAALGTPADDSGDSGVTVDLGPLDTRLTDLETKVAAIAVPDIAPLEARLDTVAADLETLKTSIAAAATTQQVGTIETRLADLGTQVSESSSGLEAVRTQAATLTTQAAALTTQVGELDAALATKADSAAVTALSGELDSLKQQVAALPATDSATFEADVTSRRSDLDALATRVAALPSEAVIAQLRSELTNLAANPPAARPPAVLERIYFGSSSTSVADEERAKIAAIAQRFASAPASLALVGFSDSQGPAELNRSLSLRRAAAVRIALLDAGVDPAAVTSVTGLGEDAPPVDSGDDTDEAGNRVVLIYGR